VIQHRDNPDATVIWLSSEDRAVLERAGFEPGANSRKAPIFRAFLGAFGANRPRLPALSIGLPLGEMDRLSAG
jgi:hypothetical protein